MAWLLRDGKVLASCASVSVGPFAHLPVGELVGAQAVAAQRLCFVGRRGGDVAALDESHCVIARKTYWPFAPVVTKTAGVTLIVAERGAFERWHLEVGDRLEVR